MLGSRYKKFSGYESDHLSTTSPEFNNLSSMSRRSGVAVGNRQARHLMALNKAGGQRSGPGPSKSGGPPQKAGQSRTSAAGPLSPYFKDGGIATRGDRVWSEEEKNKEESGSEGKLIYREIHKTHINFRRSRRSGLLLQNGQFFLFHGGQENG